MNWLREIAAGCELPVGALQELLEVGFTVIPGPVPQAGLARLAEAYDAAVAAAAPEDVRSGSTSVRVNDFVNRGPEFDGLYVHKPVLEACCHVLSRPFRLSSLLARTVRPHARAQDLHVDFERAGDGWTMVGFIFMVDEFRRDNGATRFLPGSHERSTAPESLEAREILACGPAGSMIVYNGSVWHGHAANLSDQPRRSLQGAYIRREAPSGIDLPARMRPETLGRIGSLAKYVLAV